jgi:hypothetical protein
VVVATVEQGLVVDEIGTERSAVGSAGRKYVDWGGRREEGGEGCVVCLVYEQSIKF